MSTPKKPASGRSAKGAGARQSTEPQAPVTTVAEADLAPVVGYDEQQLLNQVSKLLTGLQNPALARKAIVHGYSQEEHAEGWRLWNEASGANRPLSHCVGIAAASGEAGTPNDLLQQIDTFENTWFPRTRAIIPRAVEDEGAAKKFEQGFFLDLAQQPLGPGVVGSVRTFLTRVRALEAEPAGSAARAVRERLASRGLSAAVVDQTWKLIEAAETLTAPAPKPAVSADQIAAWNRDQRRSLKALKRWNHDWATTFRQVLTRAEQIQLGLTSPRRSDHGEDEGDEKPNPGGDPPAK